MNINDAAQRMPTEIADEACSNSMHDGLIFSLAQSMARDFFPEFCPQERVNMTLCNTLKHNIFSEKNNYSFEDSPERNVSDLFNQREKLAYTDYTHTSPLLPCDMIPSFPEWTPLVCSPVCTPEIQPSQCGLDVQAIRKDFPILSEKINGKNLIWFDNAATTQKPKSVIDRISIFYEHENSNVHRAAHAMASRATEAYESARDKIASFIHAGSPEEIIFVRGTTEGINLVAQTYGLENLQKGDEIIVSMLEHHANIVPWQMICEKKGARLKVIPVDETGQIVLPAYEAMLSNKTKLVALTQISNAIGTQTPVVEMVQMAHRFGAKTLIDGAQAIAHVMVDVQSLDCDFYTFSGHKVFGPMGIGVLYGRSALLRSMPPYQGGGSMISSVTFERSSYKTPPHRFEAGTGSIADAVGLGAAIDYVTKVGMNHIEQYERFLYSYAAEAMQSVKGLTLIGSSNHKTSILPFTLEGYTTDETGQYLDKEGVAVRTGHHCAQPILHKFGLESVVRASLAFYNTIEEIDHMVKSLKRLINH